MIPKAFDLISRRRSRPRPWRDTVGLPWADRGFSARFLAKEELPLGTGRREACLIDKLLAGTDRACLLELACGGGRTARPLTRARKNTAFFLVGIDIGPAPLEKAARRCGKRNAGFVRADIRSLPFSARIFDGAYCVFGGFLGFRLSTARGIVRQVAACLRPGGFILLDFPSENFLARLDGEQEWWAGDSSYAGEFPQIGLSENFFYQGARAYVRRDYIVDLRDGSCVELSQAHRVYSPREIEELLSGCGFSLRFCLGSWDGEPFDDDSQNLIVVADIKG